MHWRPKNINLLVQLGSQVKREIDGRYELAPHTMMRTEAAAKAIIMGVAPRLIICGGSNFGVRYSDNEIMNPADFSFGAFANSDFTRESEATVIKEKLVHVFGLKSARILAEGLSATTEENALFTQIILRRRPMFTGNERIGILTLLYHMEKAFPVWQKIFGESVEPLFAENVLSDGDSANVERICQYYSTPKGGKQYDVERIRSIITAGENLSEMMAS